MAEISHEDLVEQILLRSDVKDVIRCKSVCKSWHSLITRHRFINRHLNRSYSHDIIVRHRTISLTDFPACYRFVGYSNGLVCVISIYRWKLFIGNPLTKDVRQLKLPSWNGSSLLCWGFGYDSSEDDYKVILGVRGDNNQIQVHLLSLKSGVWRLILKLKCKFICSEGVFCNGALHWIVKDENEKNFIIGYDLSREKLDEIEQPDDPRYECTSRGYLRIIEDCLCICYRGFSSVGVWLMKRYNVKQSWELMSYDTMHV